MVKFSSIARVVLCLAVLGAVCASAAGAATLEVVGLAGAEVVVNGVVQGVLPLPAPMELPYGETLHVEVRLKGYVTHSEDVWLPNAETNMQIDVELLGLSRKTAVISSLILPGTGQLYEGRRTAGWIQMGLDITAWISLFAAGQTFQDRRDTYESFDQQYKDALTPTDISRLSDERQQAWDDMEDAETWRNVSIAAVLAMSIYSGIDAWRGASRFYTTVEPPAVSADGSTTMKAGLRWAFGGGAR